MADSLYYSVWFPSFSESEMMPRTALFLRQFPFSQQRPGITYLAIHPMSWDEPTVLEQRFNPGATPDEAVEIAGDLLHDDFAYVFEAWWDLWIYAAEDAVRSGPIEPWRSEPTRVKFIVHGTEFGEADYQDQGHVLVDLGLDLPFLEENLKLSEEGQERVRANIAKLVAFTLAVERNCGIRGRVLWSESDENLAQKLIARLQKVQ